MTKEQLLARKAELEKEIDNLPHISTVDDDGETDDDAYQEALEQTYYIRELRDNIDEIDNKLSFL